MATGMREKTTNVGGIIKRIWYAMTGATQGAELASLDDTGKFKCVSEQISSLAGTGVRTVVVDGTGKLVAGDSIEGYLVTSKYYANSTTAAYVLKRKIYDNTCIFRATCSRQGVDALLEPRIIEVFGFFNSSGIFTKIGSVRTAQAGDSSMSGVTVTIDSSVANQVTVTIANAFSFFSTVQLTNFL